MKKIRKKRCIVCHEQFTPFNSTLQKTCSVDCAIKYGQLKEAANKTDLNKMRNEKDKVNNLEEIKSQTRKLVHKYIQLRDKGKSCISCGTPLGYNYDAGHIFSAGQHNMIRYDLDNIHGQCIKCNRYNEGEYEKSRIATKERIGEERFRRLEKRAEIALRVPFTWSKYELRNIQKEIRIKIKEFTD